MANPINTTIAIDGAKLNASSTHAGLGSHTDGSGMPAMGSLSCTMQFSADMHDTTNVPLATAKKLFDLANAPTRDKVKDIRITFWTDGGRTDALCTLSVKGWISSWNIPGGGTSNHVLAVAIQPALDQQHYHDVQLGN